MFWKSNKKNFLKEASVSKADRIQIVQDFLRNEGYAPQIDSDGDVVFKYEGRTYIVILDEGDTEFFRLVFPNFWPIEGLDERARVQQAALNATAGTKVAKVFLVRDNVWATTEMFVTNPEDALAVFKRIMSALQTAVQTFANEMRG